MLALLSIGLPPVKPQSGPVLAPMTPAAPPPAAPPPAAKTSPCPRCAHANLEEARFCNACGSSMTAALQDISAPPAPTIEPPTPPIPVDPPKPAPAAEPAPSEPAPFESAPFDPFAQLDPMRTFPAEPEPESLPDSPHRPLQPGKMGQLTAFEEPSPAFDPAPSPAASPEPAPAPEKAPLWKRPVVLAAFAGLILAASGVAYMTLGKKAPAASVAELTPEPAPPPAPAEPVAPPPAEPLYSTPAPTSSPSIPDPRARKAKAKPKRVRKPRPSRAPKPAPAAEADPGDKDPLLEALLTDATQPRAEASPEPARKPAAKPAKFSLPGLQRPVSASDRAAAPKGTSLSNDEAVTKLLDGPDEPPLAEPGAASPPPRPGIEDEPAKSAEGDQLALVQVHEQFDFCAQLLAQGAYGDHYDTCLCKDARDAAPYRGRRAFYVTAKKKDASDGRLEASAKILSLRIDAGVATVKAKWKSSAADKGRDASQAWKLEDGLWCQAP